MLIELINISKSYLIDTVTIDVIQNISLSINNNEYVSIMGPSGSGKSTLMNILGCLDTPSTGEYRLSSKLISQMNDDQLAGIRNQSIGFVFQTFNLLSFETALYNVELPMIYAGTHVSERKATALKALHSVKLSHRISHHPTEMSGGERQRVAIARALVNNAPLILADEPTGNLDSHTGKEIMNIFDNLHKHGKTILIVTHDPNIAKHAQRIITLKDGQIESDEKTS
jgi:putative ABC transport system ATP-binding protein